MTTVAPPVPTLVFQSLPPAERLTALLRTFDALSPGRASSCRATTGRSEALEWDHDRLDELEHQAFAARAAGDTELAVCSPD